ncbi:MAG: hypothetical protein WDO72_03520 [Pseudomonadota bacterium]
MKSNISRRIAAVAACAAFLPTVANAAPKRVRLTVDVQVEGTEGVVGTGTDRTTARFREGYSLVTYLQSDGELAQFNSKDPEYAQKMMGLAQNVHAKVNQAQGKAPVRKLTQQQIQDYVKTKQAACGTDRGCLMKLAQEAQELMSNMDTGGATAAGNAGAYTGDEPPRFLNYFGFEKCGATSHVYVDRTTQGTLADTSGAVPYTVVDTADYRGNPVELGLICVSHNLVVDSQDGSFYSDGAVLPIGKGTSVITMRGRTDKSSGEAATHGEPYTWVSEQLRHAPRAGTRSTTMKLTQGRGAAIHSGKYSGEARIQITWKLEDVK